MIIPVFNLRNVPCESEYVTKYFQIFGNIQYYVTAPSIKSDPIIGNEKTMWQLDIAFNIPGKYLKHYVFKFILANVMLSTVITHLF